MNETNVWIINLVSNLGLGILLLTIIKFFLDRFIKQIDEKFKEHDGRIRVVENDTDKLKDHFTDEIEKVVEDKNNFRIAHSGILSEIKAKVEHLTHAVNEVKKELYEWIFNKK